ncbi:hypothetical protein BSKO_13128 [Bryopsis sp. KO-2023]|nr:hypothetical protein BSKO_13128 [Bryopsis sp. KO-2023]
MASKKRFMDALGELTDDDGTSNSGSEPDEPAEKKKKVEVSLEQLERCGYKGGSSVLLVPVPQSNSQAEMKWSDGKAHRAREPQEEDWEVREQTRTAATTAVEASADFSEKSSQQAEKLKLARREEQANLAMERRLTFRQKEKRKREAGQAKSAKNFVEEEKRVAREFGMYSGFD